MIARCKNGIAGFQIRRNQLTSSFAASHLHTKLPITCQLQNCSKLRDLKSIHATMIKNDAHQDSFFINQFVTVCARFYLMNYAFRTFTQMVDPNVYVYNSVISGFILCSSPVKAIELYIDMSESHVSPTSYTFSSLIKACGQVSAIGLGESVHCQSSKLGFGSQVFVQTALVDFYSNLGRVREARCVFDELTDRDVIAWTTMIAGHARSGDLDSARRLFEEVPERNTVSWNTLIDGYAKWGDVESATLLFNQMPVKDLVSWTTMISCYSQNERYKEAIEVFKEMKAKGVRPDEVTMATVISACAHLGALDLGVEAHYYVLQNGFDLDVYVGSALIDMYGKCGSTEKSLMVFFKLKKWNLFCWNSVIEGLAIHGRGYDALGMFDVMNRDGRIKPNRVTFVSILSACTHSGLVKEGRRMFIIMARVYEIQPGIEHYGCMVDLLGRAGHLKEAFDMIKNMRVEPNAIIWGALLGGCKIHGDLELGAVAVEQLMVLEPDNSGYYTLLVNMYAQANQWVEVASVRRMMKGKGVQKRSPGSSWIEMHGKVHEFIASDKSHPFCDEIYMLLAGLDGQLKLAGYLPEMVFSTL